MKTIKTNRDFYNFDDTIYSQIATEAGFANGEAAEQGLASTTKKNADIKVIEKWTFRGKKKQTTSYLKYQ